MEKVKAFEAKPRLSELLRETEKARDLIYIPLTLTSPARGEGTIFISPPLRGRDEGEGERDKLITVIPYKGGHYAKGQNQGPGRHRGL
jgi:hypothetical protein